MADALDANHLMGHVQDAYYFDVPRFLARGPQTIQEVPEFLRDAHADWSLAQFQSELAGKLFIPQFLGGTIQHVDHHGHSVYDAATGFCLSKFMVLEVIAATLIAVVFISLARTIAGGGRPRGRCWNFFEVLLVFIRDEVARPSIGKHDADRFLPFLWTMFFFILFCNLLGLVPWAGSATGALGATVALATITFGSVIGSGMTRLGPLAYWKAQVPHMDLSGAMGAVLRPMIFAIEVLGLCIKHTVLAVRLLANMFAGHMVVAVIVAFIGATAGSALLWSVVMPVSLFGALCLNLLELFVAFLQAYIFTFLSALFIGMAVHPH